MSSKTNSYLTVSAENGGSIELPGVFSASQLFLLEVDRRRHSQFDEASGHTIEGGTAVSGRVDGTDIHATWGARQIANRDVWELTLELRNDGSAPVRVTRMDPLAAHLSGGTWSTLAFASAWGDEWRPLTGTTDYHSRFESRSGRSSHGMSPWLGLQREGAGLIVTPAWSGNWHITLDEGARVSAGISDWQFFVDLQPGESVTAPSVVIAASSTRDAAAATLTAAIGDDWIPRSPASERLDVEWNHWWPYEDVEITEDLIWSNAAIANDLGIGVATVDAGWFGPADPTTYWGNYRGDWDVVNTARFASGLRQLGDGIRAAGPRAGIWVEAEAVGFAAQARVDHPEIMALADGGFRADPSYWVQTQGLDPEDPRFLGYVCLGSPGGREFVLERMSSVVAEVGAEWIKLDFNVDPDAGCTRTDHGHGAGDGLLRHYEGLYEVIDSFRKRHPDVVFEDCSSGGLRVDLGIARHVHTFFLSDPDYTEHALQVLWGTSLMLPPAAILHWSWSQWRGDYPKAELDFAALTDEQFATTLRAAMLHRFGISLRLPELSSSHHEVLRQHVALYTHTIADFVRNGQLARLTDQPLRNGQGERAPAFQLTLGDRHIVGQYVLPGGVTPRAVHPELGAGQYRVTDLLTGAELQLVDGDIALNDRAGSVTSWLLLVEAL